ncbi:ABC transporter substrate-binding protein [Spiribacter halobius]|uniref:Fe/B12 periplasmic-binding domain-containing protein n=1 Tax=Sediminicurvatus halobius TaxID=2182432 RepID=A0A2U2N246_9GAMM|nr:iron-siderophore ABC transporter substrate-binding protein [Spiribacter halobius]PWG63137.1 hypothetical protein DEM34_09820 [Spiribacter halobius]UEX77587.1 iron-siderophore ABC transporter substrate-binding protein [Spiribacter halobius]
MRALILLLLLAPGLATAAEGWPRVIEHPLGETRLPAPPQRVVALEVGQNVDMLLALGLPPVGSITYGLAAADQPAAWPPAIAAQAAAAGIRSVGSPGQVDLEAIAVLEPDLIIANEWGGHEAYAALSRIAPTITLPFERHFVPPLRALARALGREARAEAWIARYTARTLELHEALAGTEVAIVRPRLQSVWMYGPPSNAGRVLGEAGVRVQPLPPGASFTADAPGAIGELSLERLPAITAPHLFVILYNLEHHDGLQGYLRGPLWQRLPAVEAGNVHGVEGIAWTNHGPIGALQMLEEAAAALTGEVP